MKIAEFLGWVFAILYVALLFILTSVLVLGRNVAHFFFRLFATVSFIACWLAFEGVFIQYGLETYTGWFFMLGSFIFSVMPWFYDDILIAKLNPQE